MICCTSHITYEQGGEGKGGEEKRGPISKGRGREGKEREAREEKGRGKKRGEGTEGREASWPPIIFMWRPLW